AFREDWERQLPGVPLVVVESPYRSLVTPFLHYLDVMAPAEPGMITIVVLPEYVPRHWWDGLLYNQTTKRLRRALLGRPDTVVANVPYRREPPNPPEQPLARDAKRDAVVDALLTDGSLLREV